ncbi:MAG TPA: tetratricopeptide repeat protein [Planctomycetota bacterium]|nr:tetratricopeptide repeat protein [Planctomycetota bacterium]
MRIGLAIACAIAPIVAQSRPVPTVSMARRAAQGGDLECALKMYTEILSLHPRDLGALKGRAQVFVWSTRYPEAEVDYRRVLEVAPLDVAASTGLALTLLRENRFEEAERLVREVLAVQPMDREASLLLGEVLLRTERAAEAQVEFERALAREPADPRARLGCARALSACGREAAARALVEATATDLAARLDEHPEDTEARIARATALIRLARVEEALAEYESALGRSPGNLEAELGRASLEVRLGHLAEAGKHIESLLLGHPDSAEVHGLEGALLLRLGRDAAAGRAYASAVELDPWNTEYRLGIANSRSARTDIDGAREACDEALSLDPWSHDVRDLMSRLDQTEVPGRFRFDAGLRFDRLTGSGDDWSQETAHLAWRACPDLTVGLGIDGFQRFGADDVQATADCTWRVSDPWTLSAAYTYGPDAEVVARSAADVEVARRVGDSSTALLHLRHTSYAAGVRTDIVSPGFEFPCGPNESLLARYYFVNSSDTGDGHAGSLRLEFFPEGPVRTRIGVAYGSESFLATTAGQAIQTSEVLTMFAGVEWRCSSRTRVSLAYDYEDHRSTSDKQGLALGFTVEF